MKGMKVRFLKKLKSIRPVTSPKQGRVLRVNASDGLVLDPLPPDSTNHVSQNSPVGKEEDQKINDNNPNMLEPDIIDVSELMKDLEDEEMEFDNDVVDKENIEPPVKAKDPFPAKENSEPPVLSESENFNLRNGPLSELGVSSFRRLDPTPVKENSEIPKSLESGARILRDGPLAELNISSFRRTDLNSGNLFDQNLLTVVEQAVTNHIRAHEGEGKAKADEAIIKKLEEPPSKTHQMDDDLLFEFEEKCPPGGIDSVILYTTTLRGIRKTFEDCNSIRFLLGSFGFLFYERDVSMHSEFREELWRILGDRVVPPRLFIKGRYIGGAEMVMGLHERGKLRQLLQGLPVDRSDGPCDGCTGMRFVLCFSCSGSRKVSTDGWTDGLPIRCPECNENGLIVCPICC